MLMLNNSRWNGQQGGFGPPVSGASRLYGTPAPSMHDTYASELPRVGSTEVWELVNISADAHPIHVHLVQFQLINRQSFDEAAYLAAYAAAFPSGVYTPQVGPPNDYLKPNADGAIGGNPGISPFLNGPVLPPDPNEEGWKDTIKAYPGLVTRIAIRFAPQDIPIGAVVAGDNLYLHRRSNPRSAFDATLGPGYVWHCHILDHEDNEMMRPYSVRP
jgi:FtsP/CotA-like multicopper oxidase with cupredoxin domain